MRTALVAVRIKWGRRVKQENTGERKAETEVMSGEIESIAHKCWRDHTASTIYRDFTQRLAKRPCAFAGWIPGSLQTNRLRGIAGH